tara:strand:+ start:69 stop:194 length:126 start_codon:yes stop_codon:yes gene_type:complete
VVHDLQREWYALVALLLFFVERDVLIDLLLMMMSVIYSETR